MRKKVKAKKVKSIVATSDLIISFQEKLASLIGKETTKFYKKVTRQLKKELKGIK
jgi:hypothetical protein